MLVCTGEINPAIIPHTDGQFKDETLAWIDEISSIAKNEGKQIICFMHHGVLEHYKGQEKFYGEYIVNDYKKISKQLAENGIKVVFTGPTTMPRISQ